MCVRAVPCATRGHYARSHSNDAREVSSTIGRGSQLESSHIEIHIPHIEIPLSLYLTYIPHSPTYISLIEIPLSHIEIPLSHIEIPLSHIEIRRPIVDDTSRASFECERA
jgi:hypothetical protein